MSFLDYSLFPGIVLILVGATIVLNRKTGPILRCGKWCISWDLPANDVEENKIDAVNGILFSVFLANATTVIAEQEKGARLVVIFFYTLVSTIAIGALVGILRATTKKEDGTMIYRFDRATQHFARWSLLWCFVITGLVQGAAAFELIPGQTKPATQKAVPWTSVAYEFESDKSAGISVDVQLDPKDYEGQIPYTLYLDVKPGFTETWEFKTPRIYRGEKPLSESELASPTIKRPGARETQARIGIPSLASERHLLRILLKRKDGSAPLPFKDDKAVTVTAVLRAS